MTTFSYEKISNGFLLHVGGRTWFCSDKEHLADKVRQLIIGEGRADPTL